MRQLSRTRRIHVVAVLIVLVAACNDGHDASDVTQPTGLQPLASTGAVQSPVYVADVEQLYATVNNPANAGANVYLAAGTYILTPPKNVSDASRPNGGRLDLQENMSLFGVAGDRGAVVIDATRLTVASFAMPFGRTGVIRTGRGSNTVEWLTMAGNPLAAAGVETELGSAADASVRVAHVVFGDNARGVDVRNVGPANVGRRLHAEIVDGDFFRGVEGIRVANFADANSGDISVVMSGNRSYMNVVGCILENNRSSFAKIYVRSSGDRFYDNGIGCDIGGGLVTMASGAANSNSTTLEAYGTHWVDNRRTVFFNNTGPNFTNAGGLVVGAAHSVVTPNITSGNNTTVRLWGCMVSDNQNIDFQAFGAVFDLPGNLAGTDNHTVIELQGVSKRIPIVAIANVPEDLSGNNTVTILR